MDNKSEYKDRLEWRKAKRKDYDSAMRSGYMDDICDYFGWERPPNKRPIGYWTKERCIEKAKNYTTRNAWRKGCPSSSTAADRNGWAEECCAHMIRVNKPNGYWTKERCHEEALKYKSRGEWQITHASSYSAAMRNKWLDECCAHMISYIKESGYWNNKELILVEARKYNYPSDFEKGSPSAHKAARYYGWYEEVTSHMGRKIKPNGYWDDKEKCIEIISQCKSKEEIKKNHSGVSSSIKRNGWYKELTAHFDKPFKWTKEALLKEAKKYKTLTEFAKYSNGAYQVALRNGWLDYVTQNLMKSTKHMKKRNA